MDNVNNIGCVGFIMDGNRRWAKERGLPTLEGHTQGYTAMRSMVDAVYKQGIPHMVCYAFSTENWNRTEAEVSHLMTLLEKGLKNIRAEYAQSKEKINVRIIGEKSALPESLQTEITEIEAINHENPELTVWIALSYGGRAEIVDAVNHAIENGVKVTEETFSEYLWTNGMPDPDIIIRTSGEHRISNFLLWQSAYSEFFFTETYWPDFGETEFQSILEAYGTRKRRKGV